MPKPQDNIVEEKQPKPKKPPGWRNFQKVLKQVMASAKAPADELKANVPRRKNRLQSP
jgi:ribosomal protein S30